MAAPLALVLVVAVTVRAALFRSSLAEFISERVEVVSPLSSWKRGEPPARVGGQVLPVLSWPPWMGGGGSGRKLKILRELTRSGILWEGRRAGPKDAAGEGGGRRTVWRDGGAKGRISWAVGTRGGVSYSCPEPRGVVWGRVGLRKGRGGWSGNQRGAWDLRHDR